MQWDASPNAGFAPAGVRFGLPVADDTPTRNAAVQSQDPTSMLGCTRALPALRQAEPTIRVGDTRSLDAGAADVFVYLRSRGAARFLIVLNFGGHVVCGRSRRMRLCPRPLRLLRRRPAYGCGAPLSLLRSCLPPT